MNTTGQWMRQGVYVSDVRRVRP